MGNKWTNEEIEILKENYPIYGSKITYLLSDKTTSSIRKKAYKLGLKKETKTLYDYCQKNIDMSYLLDEWDYKKNQKLGLTPKNVGYGSNKNVHWCLPYDDPKTGKHFDFEWQARIADRKNGISCPYLKGKAVWPGFNDLATTHPEIAAEWHPIKNGILKPIDVTTGSGQKVWWSCLVCGEEWQATIGNRTKGQCCPNCNNKGTSLPELALFYYLKKVFSDTKHRYIDLGFELDIYIPSINTAIEYDGFYWHKDSLERDNKKDQLCKNNEIRLIRLRGEGLEKTCLAENIYTKENTHKQVSEGIKDLFDFLKIPHCFIFDIDADYEHILKYRLLTADENNLTTTHPTLAAQWHPTKNGNLKPENFTFGSNKKIWWLLPYDDPTTGKHFDFEWPAAVNNRKNGSDCPYLKGKAVWLGFNDLTTTHPTLAAQWHPTKNGNLKPTQVTAGRATKVWWLCPYCGYEWQARIHDRTKYSVCPYCTRKNHWLEQELETLIEYYPIEGIKVKDRLSNRTINAIKYKAHKLGLKYQKNINPNNNNLKQ